MSGKKLVGRGVEICTPDLLRPRQARYQAALRPDRNLNTDSKALPNFPLVSIASFFGLDRTLTAHANNFWQVAIPGLKPIPKFSVGFIPSAVWVDSLRGFPFRSQYRIHQILPSLRA